MFKRLLMVMALCFSVSTLSGCSILCPTCDTETPEPAVVVEEPAPAPVVVPWNDDVVYFDFDKYNIKEDYRAGLVEKAEYLKANPNARVRIEGNCDSRGTQEYNLALGERRAQAAYEYLVMLGVNPSQIEVISYGKERPAVEGTGAAVWAKNRRDDFRLIAQ